MSFIDLTALGKLRKYNENLALEGDSITQDLEAKVQAQLNALGLTIANNEFPTGTNIKGILSQMGWGERPFDPFGPGTSVPGFDPSTNNTVTPLDYLAKVTGISNLKIVKGRIYYPTLRMYSRKKGQPKWSNVQLGLGLARSYGWDYGVEWESLIELWFRESSWSETADNPTSTAYGIPQALEGLHSQDLKRSYPDYHTNPATQIRWGLNYIKNRYGSPSKALLFWDSHNWY
jgi:hypothetical protein